MQNSYVATRVMTTTEARERLPEVARRVRDVGLDAEVLFYGPNRRPEVALVPAGLMEILSPYIEDILIAERVRARQAEYAGRPTKSLAEIDAALGFDPETIAAQSDALAAELGIS
jgi:hypothetical protein